MTLALASILSPTHAANEVVPLWPTGTKGIDPSISEATVFDVCINNIHYPTLTVFRPEKPNGTAVVICPGGGYAVLSIESEGQAVARRLNADGITAFVLKYRLPRTPDADFLDPVPLSDALRAIQWVRSNAGDFGIDPARIGILGFSAGGHLAASAGTRYSQAREFGGDDLSKVSARPDFVGLVYPVISSDSAIRHGCFATLLPANSPQSALDALSPEKLVAADTPPMFLVHSKNDKGVVPENSEVLHKALERVGVPSEIHLYEQGGHGFGLGAPEQDCSKWPDAFVAWLGQVYGRRANSEPPSQRAIKL